ncbi:hypothetical protein CERZMDRAFT_87171 [Cercospora zeae-maydis SCOH1-5]|uniref:Uncharacterized protein n=1 Tax=Cercospora zeae-maydis SCOH1-5 TaxID=717836 RepID=A0A6A6F7H2_9PEZI|nr:hypothetical protein CERZMDRAFT_87171 [Cercospora zeae-maydis SCOH1-5]
MPSLQTFAATSEPSRPPAGRLPSKQAIAFAMTVVRYKPPELSIHEYIKLLRQHIAKGRRENALSSVYSHLDRSAFWRSEAERGRAALRSAENEAVDLRREIAALKGKLDNRPSSPVKKRKKIDQDVILVPRSPKKAKRAASPLRSAQMVVDLSTEEDFSQAGNIGQSVLMWTAHSSLTSAGNELLRTVFHILEALKPGRRTETDGLAYHIERACSAIPPIIQEELDRLIKDCDPGGDQLKHTLTIATRAAAAIFAGYTRLGRAQTQAEGISVLGKVTYAMVVMFKTLLHHLTTLSDRAVAKREDAENDASVSVSNARPSTARPASAHAKATLSRPATARPSSPKKSTAKAPLRPKNPKDEKIKEHPLLAPYATFLGKLIQMIDPKTGANHAIFEGFSYCVLDHLGKRLYTIVFGKPRAPNLQTEIEQSIDMPDEQQPLSHEQKQVRLEAPYLLHLLNRVMIAAPAFYGNVHGIKHSSGKTKSVNKAPAKNNLAVSARECLQRTLVNCMFGTEGVVDDPFKEYLRMPGPGEGTLTLPKIKEVDVPEHFKEEIWRVLGWDILAKEGGEWGFP